MEKCHSHITTRTVVSQIQDFTQRIYPDLKDMSNFDPSWLRKRAILTPYKLVRQKINILSDQLTAEEISTSQLIV